MSESDIEVTRRQAGKIQNLPSGKHHKVRVKTKYVCHMLEVEDLNYHLNSAVMLPDYGVAPAQAGTTPEQERITGLAVLYACYRHAREHPEQSALVVGHTDRSGSTSYNQTLSEQRSAGVLAALKGDRAGWVDIALQKSKVEDYQQILIWLTHGLGWDCDPGPKNNVHTAQTRQAVEAFQRQYNDRFSASIAVTGTVGAETWGAFFDVYMQELRYALGTDEAGLAEAQQSLRFMTCEAVGCGEEFPITPERAENYTSPIDRRVEILFFDPGEEPVVDCGAPRGACVELYEKKMYCVTPIPVDPLPLPSGIAVHVQLALSYKDPEDPDSRTRTFPKGCPVTVEYADGSSDQVKVGANGTLDFFVRREKVTFTLRFVFAEPTYFAAPPFGQSGPDEMIVEGQVADFHSRKHNVFKLPSDARLIDATWDVSGTDTFDRSDGHFKRVDDPGITNIGSAATPVKLVLDPHWLYARFTFFDRVFGHSDHGHKQVSAPQLIVEGFRQVPAAGSTPAPDTRSNWMLHPDDREKACQSIPWILQKAADGSALPKPDNKVLLQFRTEPKTFITSDDASTRRIEVITDAEALKPGPKRLKHYDLPAAWKSLRYFARLSDTEGAAFENLTAAQITKGMKPASPLVFSLDDMVVTDEKLVPLSWVPTDRAALFSHKFGEDGHTTLTKFGLYKPDTANKTSFLTIEQAQEKTRNYIVDYPNWTRLVAVQGNLCDVFDQRMPDKDGQVVGARAAVRWVDATKRIGSLLVWSRDASGAASQVAGPDAVVFPGRFYFPKDPEPIVPKAPDGSDHRFFVVQPFFKQEYIRVTASLSTGTYDFQTTPDIPAGNRARTGEIGRFDMALVRCCDTDGTTEKAAALQYFKFAFDFARAPDSLKNSAAAQKQYVEDAVANIPGRWNGPDGSFNPGPPVIEEQGADADLHVKALWFTQALANNQSHFKIEVVPDTGRSFMNVEGSGELRESAHKDEGGGNLVVAHECGHGGSLPDEYSEVGTECSYFQKPLRSNNIVTDFYQLDGSSMMNTLKEIRGRYFWHVAEWLRLLLGGTYKVRHAGHLFELPFHPNSSTPASPKLVRCFVNWPLKADINTRTAGMDAQARADVFFYALGKDKFSAQLIKAGTQFHGVVVIQLKMKISIPPKPSFSPFGSFGRVRTNMQVLNTLLDTRFNNRWRVKATVGGQTFDTCLVHFSFRYVVTTITNEAVDANQKFLGRNGGSVAGYNTQAAGLETNHDVHLEVNVIDPPTAQTSALSGKTLRLRSDNFGQFETFVTQFLGMSTAAPASGDPFPDSAQVLPLIRKVATVNAGDIQTL